MVVGATEKMLLLEFCRVTSANRIPCERRRLGKSVHLRDPERNMSDGGACRKTKDDGERLKKWKRLKDDVVALEEEERTV